MDARDWVLKSCPQLVPQLAAHNPGRHFHLGRNNAKVPGDVYWKDSYGREQVLKQTEYYQTTADLPRVVEASTAHRCVIVTGEAGVGKSTLAAASPDPN